MERNFKIPSIITTFEILIRDEALIEEIAKLDKVRWVIDRWEEDINELNEDEKVGLLGYFISDTVYPLLRAVRTEFEEEKVVFGVVALYLVMRALGLRVQRGKKMEIDDESEMKMMKCGTIMISKTREEWKKLNSVERFAVIRHFVKGAKGNYIEVFFGASGFLSLELGFDREFGREVAMIWLDEMEGKGNLN